MSKLNMSKMKLLLHHIEKKKTYDATYIRHENNDNTNKYDAHNMHDVNDNTCTKTNISTPRGEAPGGLTENKCKREDTYKHA